MKCAQSKGSKSTSMRALGCFETDTLALMYQELSMMRRIENAMVRMRIVERRIEQKRACWRIVVDAVCMIYRVKVKVIQRIVI